MVVVANRWVNGKKKNALIAKVTDPLLVIPSAKSGVPLGAKRFLTDLRIRTNHLFGAL